MGCRMTFQARRELLIQVAPRYREAVSVYKRPILDEFVAVTGYNRTYAIRLLGQTTIAAPAPITWPRARHYGPAVTAALHTAWAETNYVCAKRLVPFLPDLIPSLERRGHLRISTAVRVDLLTLSAATADRLLRPHRQGKKPHGIGTTKAGSLLKHKVPIRTFAGWDDTRVGFMEVDTVAHRGASAAGAYLSTLVLTDVATGWTECLPLLYRTQAAILRALDQAQRLLPFRLLSIDTDNGSAFLNTALLDYCAREQMTFTCGRTYRSNDQCYVEQKNGAVVRELVGYDRLEGEQAYRQLAQVYRAVRLYVNFFQPSMTLLLKRRDGTHLYRDYKEERTSGQRLLAADTLDAPSRQRLLAFFTALDPVLLVRQLDALREVLWRHAAQISTRTPGEWLRVLTYEVAHVRNIAGEGALVELTTVPGMDEELDRPVQGGERAREAARATAETR